MGLGKNRFYYTLRVRVLEELKKRQVPRYISGFLTRHGTVAQSGQLAYLKAISNLRPALWSVLVRNFSARHWGPWDGQDSDTVL